MSLENRVVLITGGSRGIGRATAIEFAKEGADIAFFYRHSKGMADETISLVEQYNVKCKAYKVDVSDFDQVKKGIEQVISDFGRIDVLINNAGIITDFKPVEDVPLDEWEEVIDVNLKGMFYCTKVAVPYLKESGQGAIVNLSSVAGRMGGSVGVAYASSKAGVIGFTFALAQELINDDVTVNAVAPGPIATEMILRLPKETQEKIRKRVPMGRLGTPEEIARSIVFLATNRFITGEVLDVNGGYYMD